MTDKPVTLQIPEALLIRAQSAQIDVRQVLIDALEDKVGSADEAHTLEVVTDEELAAEDALWDESFARSPEVLDRLIAEALQSWQALLIRAQSAQIDVRQVLIDALENKVGDNSQTYQEMSEIARTIQALPNEIKPTPEEIDGEIRTFRRERAAKNVQGVS